MIVNKEYNINCSKVSNKIKWENRRKFEKEKMTGK